MTRGNTQTPRRPAAPGKAARQQKGWWPAHRYLVLRRLAQASWIGCFLLGPLAGIWLIQGNLSASRILGTVPLNDPFLFLQTLASGHAPSATALLGAALVAGIYLTLGGRLFCAWVCPMNLVTDSAAWLRRRLGLKGGHLPDPRTRYVLLLGVCLLALLSGRLAWEWVNPVSALQRGLIFGFGSAAGAGWGWIGGVFLYDLFIAPRGWCGHLCPHGALYGSLGHLGTRLHLNLIRVGVPRRSACNDCMDCYAVCPEPQVLRPALKGQGPETLLITPADCTTCGRCIDVCAQDVFQLTTRFSPRSKS